MKKRIGIVSPAFLKESDDCNLDFYRFSNNYGKRVYECGSIPFGILPQDGRVPEEALETVDAFIVCGGKKIWPYHFQVAEYAVTHGKPILGICLGMQLIHSYFKLADYAEATGYTGDLADLYSAHEDEDWISLNAVEGHQKGFIRDRLEECKHPIKLVPGTHIHRLLGEDVIHGLTAHNYCIHDPSDKVTVSGYAEDGTVEAIEYGDKVLGVQFHPEVDDTLLPLFKFICQ